MLVHACVSVLAPKNAPVEVLRVLLAPCAEVLVMVFAPPLVSPIPAAESAILQRL